MVLEQNHIGPIAVTFPVGSCFCRKTNGLATKAFFSLSLERHSSTPVAYHRDWAHHLV